MFLRSASPDLFPDERSDVPVVSSGRACLCHVWGTGNRGTMKAASAMSRYTDYTYYTDYSHYSYYSGPNIVALP